MKLHRTKVDNVYSAWGIDDSRGFPIFRVVVYSKCAVIVVGNKTGEKTFRIGLDKLPKGW